MGLQVPLERLRPKGQVTLALFGWGCAAGTMERLAYTRASSSKFATLY